MLMKMLTPESIRQRFLKNDADIEFNENLIRKTIMILASHHAGTHLAEIMSLCPPYKALCSAEQYRILNDLLVEKRLTAKIEFHSPEMFAERRFYARSEMDI